LVYDEGFAREMERNFENNLAQSRQYTESEFNKRSFWERITEWLAIAISLAALICPNVGGLTHLFARLLCRAACS
jgi:hypothetical protein